MMFLSNVQPPCRPALKNDGWETTFLSERNFSGAVLSFRWIFVDDEELCFFVLEILMIVTTST